MQTYTQRSRPSWAIRRPVEDLHSLRVRGLKHEITPSERIQLKESLVHYGGYQTPLAFFKDYSLPEPLPEYRFHPTRKWRFDFAWPEHKLALEIQGGAWVAGSHHLCPGSVQKEHEKRNAAA